MRAHPREGDRHKRGFVTEIAEEMERERERKGEGERGREGEREMGFVVVVVVVVVGRGERERREHVRGEKWPPHRSKLRRGPGEP